MTAIARSGATVRWLMWAGIAALLLLPAIAMQFTGEVNWTASDFLVAAVLLVSAGMAVEFIFRRVGDPARRLLFAFAVMAVVGVIWADGAVGIF